ncbi:MAG: S8 family serine peptidase [Bacteroidota bacterium]
MNRIHTVATALLVGTLLFVVGCDTGSLTEPEAFPESIAQHEGPTLRHAHLMDRAVRSTPATRASGKMPGAPLTLEGADNSDLVGLIVALDPYRIFSRYGSVDPYRIFSRYSDLEGYRIFSRYEYEDVFEGFSIWADAEEVNDLVAAMEQDDEIAWVEPDIVLNQELAFRLDTETHTGDELLPWGTRRIGAGQASTQGLGRVQLFVMDTGVQNAEVALVEEMDLTANTTRAQGTDADGHGTHVAGTIAAKQDGRGMIGVAPGVSVRSMRVLTGQEVDTDGPLDASTAIAAIEQVIGYKLSHPNTPVVVNFSLGADVETTANTALDDAVEAAIANGITFVVAAGNDGIDMATVTPAHVEEAITVGAYGMLDNFAWFSNRGAGVDLLAPGEGVVSLVPGLSADAGTFSLMSGTSMAAAHVSGAAALFLAQNPTASPNTVREALVRAAKPDIWGVPNGTTNRTVYVGADSELHAMDVPPFFQYALTVDGDLRLDEEARLYASGDRVNASVFTNGNLRIDEDVRVEGFCYHAGNTYGSTSRACRPVYNPTGEATAQREPTVVIPDFDADAHRGVATQVTNGDLTLQGAYTLGTAENPVIWFVDGNLRVRGTTTISGYGVFVVKGNADIRGRFTAQSDPDVSTIGLYVEGNVDVRTSRFAAQVLAKGDIRLGEEAQVYGSLTSTGNLQSGEEMRLHYRPASPALTEPFWPVANF